MRVFRFDTEAEAVAFAKGVWACNVPAIGVQGIRTENFAEGVEFVNAQGYEISGIRSKARPTPKTDDSFQWLVDVENA